jgi:alanine racemase
MIKVSIDLHRIRQNALAILKSTGVPVIAVVKADAYGLGATEVATAIGDLVQAFYVFDVAEAAAARLWETTGKRTIALNWGWNDPADFLARHVHPVVWNVDQAAAFRSTAPVLSIDTGQQRFACPPQQAKEVRDAGDCREVMTHAVKIEQVHRFVDFTRSLRDEDLFLHAAGSALLDQPAANLDAVRPGLALYRGAVRVAAPLIDARDSAGPAGYTEFQSPRFGVILAGYSHGLRPGPCLINGRVQRVIEVGMQSSFVQLAVGDRTGDSVVLLGSEPEISESAIAKSWGCSQQEVLVRLTKLGQRNYFSSAS